MEDEQRLSSPWWRPRNAGSWIFGALAVLAAAEVIWGLTQSVFDWANTLIMLAAVILFLVGQGVPRRTS